jgi:hypothetical protein
MDNVSAAQQSLIDEEHLKLLSIFHYVTAGLSAFFSCIPFIHLFIGIGLILFGEKMGHGGDAPPAFLGWIFVIFALLFIFLGWTHAILIFLAGRFIGTRTHHTYCFVIACVECFFMPIGTILGVFTIIILSRRSVKALFGPST